MKVRKKYILGFLGIFFLVFLLLVIGDTAREWWETRKVERFAEALRQWNKDELQRVMSDTVGGKTPQETLQMYIAAVEKGDYELASKYFVEGRREEELDILRKTLENGNLDFLIETLQNVLISSGDYSTDRKVFTIEDPVFAEFMLYPNGIWKIVEI